MAKKRIVAAFLLSLLVAGAGLALDWNARPLLADAGAAPEFTGIESWLNGPPVTMAALRGKVVLVDFWAYSCINCLRTIADLKRWDAQYREKGLVIVGVHAPEFAFERQKSNVEAAIKRFGIAYKVALDNAMATWSAFDNRYWPAAYLIDQNGRIVLSRFGEGGYSEIENAIRDLLAAGPHVAASNDAALARIGSPEMQFGAERIDALASPEAPTRAARHYSAPGALPLNRFALVGSWRVEDEAIATAGDDGAILLRFRSGKVHLVAGSESPIDVAVSVDGKAQPPMTIAGTRLYTIFDSDDYGEHLLRLSVPKAGFTAYSFTFG